VLNPRKLRALLRLLRGRRKTLVYCDRLLPLATLRRLLAEHARDAEGRPLPFAGVFSGEATSDERAAFLRRMRENARCVGLVTTAGSSSLDIRDVDTVVEVDVGDASAQKQTQRIGRAQRAHASKSGAEAVLLVSDGTHEVDFARRRLDAEAEWEEEEEEEEEEGRESIEGVPTQAEVVAAVQQGDEEEDDEDDNEEEGSGGATGRAESSSAAAVAAARQRRDDLRRRRELSLAGKRQRTE
jgi:superfamily II DNA or RNA helicase